MKTATVDKGRRKTCERRQKPAPFFVGKTMGHEFKDIELRIYLRNSTLIMTILYRFCGMLKFCIGRFRPQKDGFLHDMPPTTE